MVVDLNSWLTKISINEIHENWAYTNSNDSTNVSLQLDSEVTHHQHSRPREILFDNIIFYHMFTRNENTFMLICLI